MTTWSSKVKYQGKTVNAGTLQIFTAANKMLATKTFGGEKGDFNIIQGSYNGGGVAASAGTHDGGGAADITSFNWENRVKVLRILGAAAWYRPARRNLWSAHIHLIVCGDGTVSRGAAVQVQEYYNGQDGLAGSGRDPHWRPKELPVLFVFDGDLRPRVCKTQSLLHDQPSVRGATRGEAKPGDTIKNVVAVVSVAGNRWFVTADGKCGQEKNFTIGGTIVIPPAGESDMVLKNGRYRVEANPFLWGLDQPGVGNKRIERALDNSVLRTNAEKKLPNGQLWVRSGIAWFLSDFLRAEAAPSAPGSPKIINKRIGTLNTIWKRAPGYSERVKGMGQLIVKSGASVVTTQESGTYAAADQLSKAIGPTWKNILHGDNGDLTCAIHWDSKINQLVEEGKLQTVGPHHNWATWACLRDIRSGVPFIVAATHPDYRKRGSSKRGSEWDKLRERQVSSMVVQLEPIAARLSRELKVGRVPIVYASDFNQDKDDPYDGPGRAMKLRNYVDTEITAKRRINGNKGTFNSFENDFDSGRRIDRCFALAGTVVQEQVTLFGYPMTDHNMVITSLDLTDAGRL